jgi:hypothetical protein
MTWDQKLKRLRDTLGLNADALASTLGITTRTLSDFMKGPGEGGREPTGPVQRLIDLLSGELESQGLVKTPQLNLVVIHGEFRVAADQDPVSAVVEMHAAGGTQRNNEFHYITVQPKKDAKWLLEGLGRGRIQPHFFPPDDFAMDSDSARDCYFTATTMWLVAQAMRRDLAHVTLAADAKKFWPLAREIKELAEVEVTFVREATRGGDLGVDSLLKNLGITVADPAGRKFGFVTALKTSKGPGAKIDFGFITPGQKGSKGEEVSEGSPIFFSFNHMRKDLTGTREIEIHQLLIGDYVSYNIGMNNQGPCATDVALVDRKPDAPVLSNVIVQPFETGRTGLQDKELLDIVRDAVTVCADGDGWALLSTVGSRISILDPNFAERLNAVRGDKRISSLVRAHPELFEVSTGPGTRYSAACVRLKGGS